jgi:hypothetical protein
LEKLLSGAAKLLLWDRDTWSSASGRCKIHSMLVRSPVHTSHFCIYTYSRMVLS